MADSGGGINPGGLPAALTAEDSTGSVGSGGSIADLKRFWEGKSTTPAKGSARSSLAGTPTAQRSRSFSIEAAPLPDTMREGQEGGSISALTGAPADTGTLATAAAAAVPGAVAGGSQEETEGLHPAPALEEAMPSGLADDGHASTSAWDEVALVALEAMPSSSSPGKKAGSPAAAAAAVTDEGGEQQEQGRQQEMQPAPTRVLEEASDAGSSASDASEQQEGTGTTAGGAGADQLDETTATTAQVEAATEPQAGIPETAAPWGSTANAVPSPAQPNADADEQREQGPISPEEGSPAVRGTLAPLPSVELAAAQPEVAAVAAPAAPGQLEAALATEHAPMMGKESSAAAGAGAAAAVVGEEEGAWEDTSPESLRDVVEHRAEAAEHGSSEAAEHRNSEAAEQSSSEAAADRGEPGEAAEAALQESFAAGFAAFGENPPGAVTEVSGSLKGTLTEQGSLADAAAAQACPQLAAELGDNSDGDAFGEFAEFSEATVAAADAAPAAALVVKPAEQQVSEPAADASGDDEFADFGDFDAASAPAPVAATLTPGQQALSPTTLQRAEYVTAPAEPGSQPAGLLDLPPIAFRAAVAMLLASVQAPLPQTAGGPSNHPATVPLTLASLAAVYPHLGAAAVRGQAAAAGEAVGLLHWRGSRSEARFLGRLGLSDASAATGSKSYTSDAAQSRRPAALPAADPASDTSSSGGQERATRPETMVLGQQQAAEQGPLGTAAAQVHNKMLVAPVDAAALQAGDEVEAGFRSSGAAPLQEMPAVEAAMWDQDPVAIAGPLQQQEPAVLAATVPLAAAGALAARPGPLARGAQQLPAHSTSQAAVPEDPFAAPAAPRGASAAPEGPLAKGAAQLGAPPSQPAAAWDPFAASDHLGAARPGPLQVAAQHLPAHSATAADPFAGVDLPMAAPVLTGAAAAGGLDWAEDPFQGSAAWQPASNAPAWDDTTRDAGAWGVPAAAGPADPFAASVMPVVVASSAVGGVGALTTAAAAQQPQREEAAGVEGSLSNGAQSALEPGWRESVTEGGPPAVALSPVEPAGEAARGVDDWGEDGWSDFAEAAVPGPPTAALNPVPGSVALKAGDEVGGETLVADQGGVGQGQSKSVEGGDGQSAAVDAILAQMPDLSFMLSPSLVRP